MVRPLTVKIINPPDSMVADRRYEVVCESNGSRPNAIITWYKGKRQLRRTKDDILKNTTRSELSFVPTTDDDGKSITCRSENPNVNGLYLETMWKLNVVYPPLVTLRLGSTLSPDDIKEGDDVYFECHVQSNPQWRRLLWFQNGIHLEHNTSARIIRSNQSLVLQKITKNLAGNYACSAINDEGETVSNQLLLRVKYMPVCRHVDRVILIGASKDETVEVSCEIQADPPPRTFRWKFNNSGETLDVGSERFSVNGSRSTLKYTPMADQDYGTLSCWAANEVGIQNQPCLFQVVLAAHPNAVANCTVYNKTDLIVEIQCVPGYDGGLPQIFVLEIFSMHTGITRYNLTNTEEPHFLLENLGTLTSLVDQENKSLKIRIYSFNQKGRGPSYILHDIFIGTTIFKKEDEEGPLLVSPVIVGSLFTIVIITLVIAIKTFLATFFHNMLGHHQHEAKAIVPGIIPQSSDVFKKNGNLEKPRWQHTDFKSQSSEDLVEDERDPDVIPSQYDGNIPVGREIGVITSSITQKNLIISSSALNSKKFLPNSNSLKRKANMSSNETSVPIAFNQISTRTNIFPSSTLNLPTTTLTRSHHGTTANDILDCSNTSSHTTAIITDPNQLQNQVHQSSMANDTLSTELGTDETYILNSIINDNCRNSYTVTNGFIINGSIKLINCNDNKGNSSIRHLNIQNINDSTDKRNQFISALLPIQSSSSLSICGRSTSNVTSPLLAGNLCLNGSVIPDTTKTLNTLYNSSTDLEDNININDIKDCLMTQRVPESCV